MTLFKGEGKQVLKKIFQRAKDDIIVHLYKSMQKLYINVFFCPGANPVCIKKKLYAYLICNFFESIIILIYTYNYSHNYKIVIKLSLNTGTTLKNLNTIITQ